MHGTARRSAQIFFFAARPHSEVFFFASARQWTVHDHGDSDGIFVPSHAYYGLSTNQHGGLYTNGSTYGVEKKLEVSREYLRQLQTSLSPSINKIASSCKVSRCFAAKVVREVKTQGRVVDPKTVLRPARAVGPGAKTIDEIDAFVLLVLYLEEPSRTAQSYVDSLYFFVGTTVSSSTISRFFNHAFPIRGSLVKPNLVPFDKFKPENLNRTVE